MKLFDKNKNHHLMLEIMGVCKREFPKFYNELSNDIIRVVSYEELLSECISSLVHEKSWAQESIGQDLLELHIRRRIQTYMKRFKREYYKKMHEKKAYAREIQNNYLEGMDSIISLRDFNQDETRNIITQKIKPILTHKQFVVFQMYIDGSTYKQMSESLGVQPSTIRDALRQCRLKISQKFPNRESILE